MFGLGRSFIKSSFSSPIPHGKVLIQATNSDGDIGKDYQAQLLSLAGKKYLMRVAQLSESEGR